MISFEKFVAVRAALERGDSRRAILEREAISPVVWQAAQRRWMRVLVEEARRGGGERRAQYLAAFAAAAPMAVKEAISAPIAAKPAKKTGPMAAIPVAGFATSVSAPAHSPERTITDDASASVEPMPFRRGDGRAPAKIAAEIQAEAAAMVGETGFVAALTDEELMDEPAAADIIDLEDPAERTASVDTTGFVNESDLMANPLPFRGDSDAPRAPAPMLAHDDEMRGDTGFVPALRDEDLVDLPFESGSPSKRHATLTLEQYASLRAELDRRGPDARAATLARYGLPDEAAFVELKRGWSEHFQRVPSDYGRFRAGYDAYSRWLE